MRIDQLHLHALLLLIFPAANTVSADDWTTYRHDNSRSGATTESLTLPLQQTWVNHAPARPRLAWSGPDERTIEGKKLRHRVRYDDAFQVAVAGQRVYFGSSVDHQMRCVDLHSGKQLWRFFTDAPIRLAPTFWQGRVYFGCDDGRAYCLDANTGALVWKIRPAPVEEWILARGEMISRWPVRTGVTVDEGIAYFGAGIFPHEDVFLYAVDAKTGKVIWKKDNISEAEAGRNDLSPQGYLLTTRELLFVPSGRSLPAAIRRKDGKPLHKRIHGWRGTAGGVVGGTRALLADGQLYAAGPHHMLAMDQKTGSVGFGYFEGKQLAVIGKEAYAATGTEVRRLDRLRYAEVSRQRQKLQMELSQLRRQLYRLGKKGAEIRARVAEIAKLLPKLESKGIVWATPSTSESALIVAGQHIFVGGTNRVEAFDRTTGKRVWNAKVAGQASGLAVANGHLVVSTTEGKVYTFADAKQSKATVATPSKRIPNPYSKDNTTLYADAAKQILDQTGVKKGFCLVVGSERGQLAYELARQSELKIYGVDASKDKVTEARKLLAQAGLYGSRITIHHVDAKSAIPYSNYFANLIVSDTLVSKGKLIGDAQAIARHLKPLGGVLYLGRPEKAPGKKISSKELKRWLVDTELEEESKITPTKQGTMLVRGKLPGAADWSHQYGNPGNTASSEDHRIKGGLGVLWYGDPGPGKMVNRHEGAVGPVSVHGRLIVQGQESVLAYDAYNGRFLWEYKNPDTFRTGVFQNWNPSNLVASKDSVFVMSNDRVVQLDAATGKQQAMHRLPPGKTKDRVWGYVAYQDGKLFGTATVRKELLRNLRRRGRKYQDNTDAIFAIDTRTGKHLWVYEGKSIAHRTIALGPKRVYFIDSTITSDQRAELLREDKTELKKLKGKEAKLAEERMKRLDARLAVAVDIATGKKVWSKPVDVTDCSNIGIGGGKLTLMYADGALVLGGANANGHYWKQFVAGDFSRRRLVVLSASDGKKLWARDANYRHRPIIVGDKVIAEPWAFELKNGKQQQRLHPLTGKPVPWSIVRPGHHCGMLTGCPNLLMFRSGYTGFYDLYADVGTRHFAGHRLGCWINAIPANGLVMIPEASAGCVCLFSIASTIVLEPRQARRPWTIASVVGASTPVQHMALNLGAPGDRKDAEGTLWLSYPRPGTRKETSLDLKLDLKEKLLPDSEFHSISARSTTIAGAFTPWLYTSWANGLTHLSLPLLGKGDDPALYTVRLYFAEVSPNAKPGQRVFDVQIQGKTVLKNFDPVAAAGKPRQAVNRSIADVRVTENLEIRLIPRVRNPNKDQMPLLNAIQVKRQGE